MKNVTKLALLIGVLVLPIAGYHYLANAEETFLYVDVNGNVQTEIADTPAQAIVEAENRDPNSGVMETEVEPIVVVATDEENAYAYVDVEGDLQTIVADTATEAIVEAPERDPNSGVMIIAQ